MKTIFKLMISSSNTSLNHPSFKNLKLIQISKLNHLITIQRIDTTKFKLFELKTIIERLI
jgi:ribosomal protein L17